MGLLDRYLKKHNTSMYQLHLDSGIPESTVRSINKKPLKKWTIEQLNALAHLIEVDNLRVLRELEEIEQLQLITDKMPLGKLNLENRRYIGSKAKLMPWIRELMSEYTSGNSIIDVFSGTGIVAKEMLPDYDTLIINDFLYSNEVIYKAFFQNDYYDRDKLLSLQNEFRHIETNEIDNDYLVTNYGGKFFSNTDTRIIGEIRERIQLSGNLSEKEEAILIASLLYSADRIANTVGHYDAYRKNVEIKNKFEFELINPLDTTGKNIKIYREDANNLVRKEKADVAFIDPPYNSRQYSRFYHVLEVLTKWDKPDLTGVAMKPPTENVSEYCKSSAPDTFDDLIKNLSVNYIVVTYNNTYNPRSSSSKNKITHEEIRSSLSKVGLTKIFERPYKYFNSGKTDFKNHKEIVFITEVTK